LQVEDGAIGYDKQNILAEPIQLDIRKTDSVALVGPNGIGKSTLLKSIIHKLPFIRGEVHLGTNVTIGYYDQGQADLHSNKTILQELWDEHPTTPEVEIRNVLGGFLFSGQDVEKTIPLLSGGEKARVALAKLAMNQENFLILDEPTNHLDIDNKEVLENALIDYEGTLFFVSHDRYFINRVATKVIELSENGTKVYLGDYDYYIEKKQEERELAALLQLEEEEEKVASIGKQSFQQSKEQQKQVRQVRRRVEQLEMQLAEIEEKITNYQMEMANPTILDDHVKLQELNNLLENAQEEQLLLLDQWEQESIILENLEK
jgi:ATP-binding cassette subfamily F protein 3